MITIDIEKASVAAKEKMEKEKSEKPIRYGVTAGVVGATAGTLGVLALRSGFKRLANTESTYGGVGPILTGVLGVGLSIVSICAASETIETVGKHIKLKKSSSSNKESESSENKD